MPLGREIDDGTLLGNFNFDIDIHNTRGSSLACYTRDTRISAELSPSRVGDKMRDKRSEVKTAASQGRLSV